MPVIERSARLGRRWRRSVLLAVGYAGVGACAAVPPGHDQRDAWPGDGYELVWAQDFNEGDRPDDAVWNFEQGFSRNREAQWYQRENAFIEDGLLVIEARQERVENPGYEAGAGDWRKKRRAAEITSSSLTTKGTAEWTYGRFEMRARVNIGAGMWPAWWTVGDERPWPGGGEIDMMEYYRGMILANACWKKKGGRWEQHWDSSKTLVSDLAGERTPEEWASEFHVWRMDWTEDEIIFSLDGRVLNTVDVTKTINPDGTNPFREPQSMLVNLAVGGTNGGDISEAEFPSRYEIDYIRVYQRPDSTKD